jgi:hypothetical protein
MAIWKYTLALTDVQVVPMPADAVMLSVANQRGSLCLWAMVDPSQGMASRTIEIFGTGHVLPPAVRSFIGTVVMDEFVWHVFEERG